MLALGNDGNALALILVEGADLLLLLMFHLGDMFLLHGFCPRFAGTASVGGALGGLDEDCRLSGNQAAGFGGVNTVVFLSGCTKPLPGVLHRRSRGGFHRLLRKLLSTVDEARAFIREIKAALIL